MSSAWKARLRLSHAHCKCSPRCVQSLHVNVRPSHFGLGVVVSRSTPSDSIQQTTSIHDQVWYHLMIRGRTNEHFDLLGCGKVRKSFLFRIFALLGACCWRTHASLSGSRFCKTG